MSDSLRPCGLQHTRPPCPSATPRVYSNSCPLSWWCHPTISSSVSPSSSRLRSFPSSGCFQMNQSFESGGQSIGVSASTSVLPVNLQDWSPLEWAGWISWLSKGLSRVFSNTTVQKHQFFSAQLSFYSQLSHPYMTTGKTIALTRRTFVGKVMSLFSNMLICSLKTSIKVFLNPHRPGEGEDIELGKGQQAKSWADWASFRHHNVPGDSLSTRRLAESLMGVKGNLGLFQYKVS